MIAYILLGERLNGVQVVGSVMILAAVVLMRVYKEKVTGHAALKPKERSGALLID
jgi:drug/metabolite transporter (DMT)-like permease